MKYSILWLILGFCSLTPVRSQIKIDGTLRDAETREEFGLAHVVLQTPDSAWVQGTTSDATGRFSFDSLAAGDYRLVISGMGYATHILELIGLDSNRSLGDIFLEPDALALDGITVSASTVYPDKKMVFLSSREIGASTNGINVLQQLMLPKVQVNPLFDEVSVPGEGEIQFRINGAQVEPSEVKALQPAEIIRIDYYDNSGLRYGNAEVVLDYIVRRPQSGGGFGVDLSDAFQLPKWGNNSISGKVNRKRSEFSALYSIRHRDFDRVSRDNRESFLFPDHSMLHRWEEGESGRMTVRWQTLNAAYSFVKPEKRILKSTFRYTHDHNPHADYTGYLYNTAEVSDRVYMVDRTAHKSVRPSLDLYYMENLKNGQTLVFNLVGTYHKTEFDRFYQESRDDHPLTRVDSRINGKRYSLIGEGVYENKIGSSRISLGLKHTQSTTDNVYRNDRETHMDQSETYAYGEFRGKADKLDYTLGVGVTRSQVGQRACEGYEEVLFNPRFSLHYSLAERSYLRLNGSIHNNNPSLSHLSDVEQAVDAL
ncbi:MAG: carboxypeptidase-like regulatory domain-containing protein [Rikenellaceae bacterium]|nr:carboxypeptidase-like regulatory domain-containing protein [Rikenellaceae bacterium]